MGTVLLGLTDSRLMAALVHQAAGPALNCDDLPEASMPGGCGPISRRLGYRADRHKSRIKSLPLPALGEMCEDADTASESDQPTRTNPDDAWPCCICSFLNSSLMPLCEICGTARSS